MEKLRDLSHNFEVDPQA
jgi:hypothetical protein